MLGAVEGPEVITPAFKPYVMPVSVAIIVGLLMGQCSGTEVATTPDKAEYCSTSGVAKPGSPKARASDKASMCGHS